jgi:hypothetical protein
MIFYGSHVVCADKVYLMAVSLCPSPQVLPKPVLGIFSTSVPVIHSDLGADDLENAYLRGILQLTQVCFLNLFHLQNVLCFSVNRIKLLCRP